MEGREPAAETTRLLLAKHILRRAGDELPLELLAMKLRTQYDRLSQFTSLHMFVVTLRCEHTCQYCQVSRQNVATTAFDMSEETATAAVETVFRSPSPNIKIEFQGGEPLLNFPAIRSVVQQAERANTAEKRNLGFVIATNLAMLDEEILDFAAEHGIHFSTSLDGPADIHNRNRPRPGRDSWERAVAGIDRIRARLGADAVTAVMTTTNTSLTRVRDIIDTYVEHGFHEVFLRPISPYGFATRLTRRRRYEVDAWLDFYREGIDYIIDLNRNGTPVVETYTATILKKMLTNSDPGYVDLTSPAGMGIGALVYNYDGDVYASDEGRMLAEMGDTTFRLGNLHRDSYTQMMTSEALLGPLDDSFADSCPMCTDCAYERFCGSDPTFHHTTMGDPVGRKAESDFCRRNMSIFRHVLGRFHNDEYARRLFRDWAGR